ncbi:sterol desaturase family protein [Vreelandella massiliensis]|uniref:sterol desaturase family protein n=1 Tax=Vreelandella massiliensis TaxID=1816686 RepID=UPI0009F822EE|nr:sterol desaturase family protein [Halomonas massiliensis]
MLTVLAIVSFLSLLVCERLWPANGLPRVRAWWPRLILLVASNAMIAWLMGMSWIAWTQSASMFSLAQWVGNDPGGLIVQLLVAFFISTAWEYWWHRWRHRNAFLWRVFHQLHHSPRRVELVTALYRHPVEQLFAQFFNAIIVYFLLGCSPAAGALYVFLRGGLSFFQHWNVRTPYWLGFVGFFPRPELHRMHHHEREGKTCNFADLPIFDMVFGTFHNPRKDHPELYGFTPEREDRFTDILAFRDVNRELPENLSPMHRFPTCIGCQKRWACAEVRGVFDQPDNQIPKPVTLSHYSKHGKSRQE